MKVALLSNITVDLLADKLRAEHQVYLAPGYNAWQMEIVNPASGLHAVAPQVIFVLLHGEAMLGELTSLSEGVQALDQALAQLHSLSESFPEATVFVSNLDIEAKRIRPVVAAQPERAWEWHWYQHLQQLVEQRKNIYILDLKSLVEAMGREAFYAPKMWYLGGMPYSLKALAAIEAEMKNLLLAGQGKRLKALAVDLDNTLWGGVIGEDGLAGIKLATVQEGARYRDLQKRLLELKETGTILVMLSKNNPEDALEAIREHRDMVLKESDFAALRINWQSKPDNLAEVISELNLGVDAFAFLDDNPVEREQMRVRLPEVALVDFPKDTALLEKTLRNFYREHFLVLRLTEEDQMKTEMYQAEKTRQDLRAKIVDVEEYLLGLDIEIDIHTPGEDELERVAQMTQKTNQFNLTTRRYTIGDIRERVQSPDWRLYVVRSRDKYGDDGVILLLMAEKRGEVAYIDTLLLSCRVMGRLIEQTACERIIEELYAWGCTEVRGEYLPTKKNGMAERFYEDLGFTVVERDEKGTKYQLLPGELKQWPRVHKRVVLQGKEIMDGV